MATGDTYVNALLGAVVTVVLSFLPLSPLLGGLLAGYLEGGDREAGIRVGSLAGLIALVPFLAIAVFFGGLLGFFLVGTVPVRVGAIGIVLFLVLLVLAGLYTIGLGAVGGWLGTYVRADTEIGR